MVHLVMDRLRQLEAQAGLRMCKEESWKLRGSIEADVTSVRKMPVSLKNPSLVYLLYFPQPVRLNVFVFCFLPTYAPDPSRHWSAEIAQWRKLHPRVVVLALGRPSGARSRRKDRVG